MTTVSTEPNSSLLAIPDADDIVAVSATPAMAMECCHVQVLQSLELHPKPSREAIGSASKADISAAMYAQKPLEEPLLEKA